MSLDPLLTPLAYLNGTLLPQPQAALPLHDAGFVMGVTVTDLCRTVRHQLYRWPDHLHRFLESCRSVQLMPPLADDELTGVAHELVAHNAQFLRQEEDLALVLFLTPGPIGYYGGSDGGAGDAPPTLGMHTFPLPFARYRRLFREGAHLATATVRAVPAECIDPRIKQRSRLHWWLADRDAQTRWPGAAALLLDDDGHLTETAAANLLVVKNGVVQSPPSESVLRGVSLRVVRELCAEMGISFVDRPLTVADALCADEILLTSTPYCLAAASRFNDVATPWPGPVYERLSAAWNRQACLDLRAQILTHDAP